MKVEQLFACHRLSEERKVPLATLSFQGNVMNWRTALKRERHLHKDPPITYWNDLRGGLRCRHIPSNVRVEEYWQKMVLYIKRAGINEENHTTCTVPSPGIDQRSESTHGGTPQGTQGREVNRLTARVIASLRRRLSEASPKRGVAQERHRPEEASPERGVARERHRPRETSSSKYIAREASSLDHIEQ